MEEIIHEDKTFEKLNFTSQEIRNREFLRCKFKSCDFSSSNFNHNQFIDCEFVACNMAMLKLVGTTLSNVTFRDCKPRGEFCRKRRLSIFGAFCGRVARLC